MVGMRAPCSHCRRVVHITASFGKSATSSKVVVMNVLTTSMRVANIVLYQHHGGRPARRCRLEHRCRWYPSVSVLHMNARSTMPRAASHPGCRCMLPSQLNDSCQRLNTRLAARLVRRRAKLRQHWRPHVGSPRGCTHVIGRSNACLVASAYHGRHMCSDINLEPVSSGCLRQHGGSNSSCIAR
jgi:hypothetical protein